ECVCATGANEALERIDLLAREGKVVDVLFVSSRMPYYVLDSFLRQVKTKDILGYCRLVATGVESAPITESMAKLGVKSCVSSHPEHLKLAALYWASAARCSR